MFIGDIVGIINLDDFYYRGDVLEKVVELFEVGEIEVIYGDVCFVNFDNLDRIVCYYFFKRFVLFLF